MRLCYVLLSDTFGMHQYTADLANRMARSGHEVHLVTAEMHARDRYTPSIRVSTPVDTRGSGISLSSLNGPSVRRAADAVGAFEADVVHFTGPHVWNTAVMSRIRRLGVPIAHTLHDLDPHPGSIYGSLLYLWNRAVTRRADEILVHAVRYRNRLVRMGLPTDKVSCTPLLHLFLGHTWLGQLGDISDHCDAEPMVLFFGRLAPYKGIDQLLTAWAMMDREVRSDATLVLAGSGRLERVWAGDLPEGVQVRNSLMGDQEAIDLFRRCSLLVLPYTGASQSALVPAAYFFRKPVIVSPSGALHEYVKDGETGWVVEAGHPASLARCLEGALRERARLSQMGEQARTWYDLRRIDEENTLTAMYQRLASRRSA